MISTVTVHTARVGHGKVFTMTVKKGLSIWICGRAEASIQCILIRRKQIN